MTATVSVANSREARDVLDHLGVVIRGEERFVRPTVRHRQPTDEVGEPAVGRTLLVWVLVQVVVKLPGLVTDPDVVIRFTYDVVEDHEVRQQDLVHSTPRLEAVEVVLRRLAFDVTRLVCEVRAGRVNAFVVCFQHGGDRVLRQPVDLEIRLEPAQFLRDGDVALGMAEADRRGDVERALGP